jgi:hypothetical protein
MNIPHLKSINLCNFIFDIKIEWNLITNVDCLSKLYFKQYNF